MIPNQYNGLTMPVFNAFGWAGEEAALTFALSQLELFAAELHKAVAAELQAGFPFHGIHREGQYAYLAAEKEVEDGVHVTFVARPMIFQMNLSVVNRARLDKLYKTIEERLDEWYDALQKIGPEWTLRLQKMQVEEETLAHSQDLYKESASQLSLERAQQLVAESAYLNSDPRWLVPFYLSLRLASEQVASMGRSSSRVMADYLNELAPLLEVIETAGRKKRRAAPRPKPTPQEAEEAAPEPAAAPEKIVETRENFTYIAELRPLHIRKGFVNLTRDHWPFFARSARTEVQPVTLFYGDRMDKDSSIWRLVSNDQARIVLSDPARSWLRENFSAEDRIQVRAVKVSAREFQVTLSRAETSTVAGSSTG